MRSIDHGGMQRRPVASAAVTLLVGLALAAASLATSGCERGCIRMVSLAAQQRADAWLRASRDVWEVRREKGFDIEPGSRALEVMRARQAIGGNLLQGLDLPAQRAAMFALLGVERDDDEHALLRALLANPRVDPFRAEPSGVVPYAFAIGADPLAVRWMTPLLARFPRTRPPDAVLCGLRMRIIGSARKVLLGYCPCVKDDD